MSGLEEGTGVDRTETRTVPERPTLFSPDVIPPLTAAPYDFPLVLERYY